MGNQIEVGGKKPGVNKENQPKVGGGAGR